MCLIIDGDQDTVVQCSYCPLVFPSRDDCPHVSPLDALVHGEQAETLHICRRGTPTYAECGNKKAHFLAFLSQLSPY